MTARMKFSLAFILQSVGSGVIIAIHSVRLLASTDVCGSTTILRNIRTLIHLVSQSHALSVSQLVTVLYP